MVPTWRCASGEEDSDSKENPLPVREESFVFINWKPGAINKAHVN